MGAPKLATLQDLIDAESQGRRVELIDGELVEKEAAGNEHSAAHDGVVGTLRPHFRGRGGGERPGGWAFRIEASVLAPTGDVVVPDIAGWHRDRAPATSDFPIRVAPDWACEVVYSTHLRDTGKKPPIFHAMKVGHYWVVDLRTMLITVYRWTPPGYVHVTAVGPEALVRLEPFDAVELPAWELFGFEDPP